MCWKGPELEPVLDTDPLAGCVQLQQPSFSSGEIQLRALGKKAYEETMETLVCAYFVITVGPAKLGNVKSGIVGKLRLSCGMELLLYKVIAKSGYVTHLSGTKIPDGVVEMKC